MDIYVKTLHLAIILYSLKLNMDILIHQGLVLLGYGVITIANSENGSLVPLLLG